MEGIKAGTGGNRYVPYAERTGNESIVYFTRDLSPEGMAKVYERVKGHVLGRVAIKLHTGEPHGPNIIPPGWVKVLMEKELPGATIVETNTFYEGDRYTTEQHRRTLEVNGWTEFTSEATIDHFGRNVVYVNVLRNMSVSCDCEGVEAKVAFRSIS